MNNTLKIQIPDGYVIDKVDIESGEIRFKSKPKNVIDRVKTVEDAIAELGEKDTEVSIYRKLRSVLTDTGMEHPLYQQEAIIIAKALNEGWQPDWSNSNQPKYFPYFYMSGFRFFDGYDDWCSGSTVGSRLAFKSKELAMYAGKKFENIYKGFMI